MLKSTLFSNTIHSADLKDFLNSVDPSPILPLRNGRFGVNGTGRVWAANGRFLDPDTTSRQLLTHANRIVHFLFVWEKKIILDESHAKKKNQSNEMNYCSKGIYLFKQSIQVGVA